MTVPKKITALVELTTPAICDVLAIVDLSEPFDADKTKKITLANLVQLVHDTTPVLGSDLDASDKDLHNMKQVDFQDTHDNANSGAAKTINWNEGNVQKVRLTGNVTFTFTAPAGPCGLTLYLIGDGSVRTTTFPATAKFIDDGEPDAWGSTNNEIVGIITMRYDAGITPNYIMSAGTKGA